MLTRQHFNAIARCISEAYEAEQDATTTPFLMRAYIARKLASMCDASNPAFNRDKFMRACFKELEL